MEPSAAPRETSQEDFFKNTLYCTMQLTVETVNICGKHFCQTSPHHLERDKIYLVDQALEAYFPSPNNVG